MQKKYEYHKLFNITLDLIKKYRIIRYKFAIIHFSRFKSSKSIKKGWL